MTTSEDNAFRPTRRTVLAGLAVTLFAPNIARAAETVAPVTKSVDAKVIDPTGKPAVAVTEPPLLAGDYAKERHKFRTDLLNKGPAPDKYEPLVAPSDADQIFYRSGLGGELELVAWVSRYERTPKPKPAVLFLHGGNAIGQGHWLLAKPYVDAGYVVMIPSMRGENGQKGNFSGFYDEVADVLAASNRLRHLPGVDPHRLFLAGHSVGGTLAMLAAMSAKRFRAATPMSGNPDSFAFFHRYPEDIRFNAKNPREFQMRSPICYAHSFKCPLKVMQASEEGTLQARATLLSKRALAAGIKMELVTVQGNHNSALPGEIEQSIQFFKSVAA
ncbi:alpha/beta hydrolase family protein [Rhizobium leucaenae]|uniref:Dipeptidyl aminopeptidase/acylaminoacyl peptidase n=1 Tax=Rhizobium leucaenae TaxID=29450 RepID=A0A7W7EKC7_9HYPH|nr:alpha/beta fold hydrolase [Rhizobium leucaenae]MBB4568364.1 dipeptidyl aminopeptidase/acylaminoacyl peptidase [Rhizobium leucaenae]MBB6300477.1 dipeptidyl aminopeptidase/acylaminoacyl peptidase [Rhizobium leucaenae]